MLTSKRLYFLHEQGIFRKQTVILFQFLVEDIQNAKDFPSVDNSSIVEKILFPFEIILGWGIMLAIVLFYDLLIKNIVEHRWYKKVIQAIINIDSMIIGEVLK